MDGLPEQLPATQPAAPGAELATLEAALVQQLALAGLPTESVFVPVEERARLIGNLEHCLARVPPERRLSALYLSKMVAAAFAGLFDAALNYLWDETVAALRDRAANYDLTYFFDVAVSAPEKRRTLKSVGDLARIDDIDLLRAAREVGLISDVGHAQLDHIRHMRNHASAAHPNQTELTGLNLADWLETCLRQAILLPLDNVTAETGQLLRNIKDRRLDPEEIASTAAFFNDLPGDRPDALAAGFFGLYAAEDSSPVVRDNVIGLWPEIWPHVSEEQRYEFGTKYARYIANADERKSRARELLDLVEAAPYMPEPTRVGELAVAMEALLTAHRQMNNFYNEPPAASTLSKLVGERGDVPETLRPQFAAVLMEVALTNGNGNAWNADPHYRSMLERLDSRVAGYALRTIGLDTIKAKLRYPLCQERWTEILEILRPKITRQRDTELLAAIDAYGGPIHRLASDPAVARLSARRQS